MGDGGGDVGLRKGVRGRGCGAEERDVGDEEVEEGDITADATIGMGTPVVRWDGVANFGRLSVGNGALAISWCSGGEALREGWGS